MRRTELIGGYSMAIRMTKPDGTRVVMKTLRDLTENMSPQFCFCLAAKTAFVFIGTTEELVQGAEQIDRIYRGRREDYLPLMDRRITGYRKRDVPGEPKHMVLIEGDECGAFWLRSEYLAFRQSGGRKLPVSRSLIAYNRKPREAHDECPERDDPGYAAAGHRVQGNRQEPQPETEPGGALL
jgi:hypothetical protein